MHHGATPTPQVKLQLTLLMGWPQPRSKSLQEVPVAGRDIPHPLVLQPNTPSRCLVWDTCLLSTQVHNTSWETLSARRRAGLPSPGLTQGWGLGQSTASYLVSSAVKWLQSPNTFILPSAGNFIPCISYGAHSPLTLHISKCSVLFPKSPFVVKGISNVSSLLLLPLTRRWESYTCWKPFAWRVPWQYFPPCRFLSEQKALEDTHSPASQCTG